MSHYKKYLLRQLGIKESQIKPSTVNRNAFPGIDPEELEQGADEESQEHDLPPDQALHTATDHLKEPGQEHYYSGMQKAKTLGMLDGMHLSPTAIATPVIGMAVRGSSTGGFPSGRDQTGISTNTPTGRLGGYEPIPIAKDNSELVDKTPCNQTINSNSPINDGESAEAEPHPFQVQNIDTDQAQMPDEQQVDINIENEPESENEEGEENEEDGEEQMPLNEGKHKSGCKCNFCKNKNRFGKKSKDKKDDDKDDADDKGIKNDKKEKKEKNSLDETFKRHLKLMNEHLNINQIGESGDVDKLESGDANDSDWTPEVGDLTKYGTTSPEKSELSEDLLDLIENAFAANKIKNAQRHVLIKFLEGDSIQEITDECNAQQDERSKPITKEKIRQVLGKGTTALRAYANAGGFESGRYLKHIPENPSDSFKLSPNSSETPTEKLESIQESLIKKSKKGLLTEKEHKLSRRINAVLHMRRVR